MKMNLFLSFSASIPRITFRIYNIRHKVFINELGNKHGIDEMVVLNY